MDEYRSREGRKAAIVGIGANTFLTFFNIIVGLISGSYALISEGAHTLSDVATSIIAYIGFRIGQKPADKEHNFGHGRAEAISGLVTVVFLFLVAYEILRGAILKIINPQNISVPSYLALSMAVTGIFINLIISTYIIRLGKKISSPAMIADGKHQQTDIYSSVAILIGILISNAGYPIFDPVIGLFIGMMILKTAYEVARDNINNIMGKVPSKELIDNIIKKAKSVEGVQGIHNIKIDYYGTYAVVSAHIELDPSMTLIESHAITHQVQKKILEIPIIKSAITHACPVNIHYNHKQEIDE